MFSLLSRTRSSSGKAADRRRPLRGLLPYSVVILAASLSLWIVAPRPAHAQTTAASRFSFFQEFYGSEGYTDPQAAAFLQQGTMNGLTFTPPVVPGVAQLAATYGAGLILRLPDGAAPAGISGDAIAEQATALTTLAVNNPQLGFTWDLMPEWDQSGGSWVPQGRPSYTNLTRAAAHAAFLHYYQNNYSALMSQLGQSAAQRNYRLAAVTDYSPNTFYAFEMGVDLCLLERGIDELGDLSTGIAFLRGAARQYNRAWGIDLSSWRTSNGMATQYSNQNVLQGGWSASYIMRHYYASFLAGANLIQNEAATYRNQDGRLNPLGVATEAFADFALHRHPDLGSPMVSAAFLIDRNSGFDPKHGVYNQANAIWYQEIPYTSGDFMIDNVFRLAYPNHWLHGLTPGAPFANSSGVPDPAQFRAYLASGGDPRPYEPMPSTRWGDNLDVITTAVQASALSQYKVIVLLGDVHLDSRLRADLRGWVQNGGVLLMNTSQMRPEDADLAGVMMAAGSPKSAASSRWLASGTTQSEAPYLYTPIQTATADVLAVNEFADPLLTRQKLGDGEVLLGTPLYMQSAGQDRILQIGVQLLDSLMARYSVARITGPPVEYIVNQASGKIVVALINNSGSDWSGNIAVKPPNPVTAVSEYTKDQPVQFSAAAADITIPAQVPAYCVRVFGVEYAAAGAVARVSGKKAVRAARASRNSRTATIQAPGNRVP